MSRKLILFYGSQFCFADCIYTVIGFDFSSKTFKLISRGFDFELFDYSTEEHLEVVTCYDLLSIIRRSTGMVYDHIFYNNSIVY